MLFSKYAVVICAIFLMLGTVTGCENTNDDIAFINAKDANLAYLVKTDEDISKWRKDYYVVCDCAFDDDTVYPRYVLDYSGGVKYPKYDIDVLFGTKNDDINIEDSYILIEGGCVDADFEFFFNKGGEQCIEISIQVTGEDVNALFGDKAKLGFTHSAKDLMKKACEEPFNTLKIRVENGVLINPLTGNNVAGMTFDEVKADCESVMSIFSLSK